MRLDTQCYFRFFGIVNENKTFKIVALCKTGEDCEQICEEKYNGLRRIVINIDEDMTNNIYRINKWLRLCGVQKKQIEALRTGILKQTLDCVFKEI